MAVAGSRPPGQGERKLVTTLFADLSGFTALSETMDPEEVRELVNDCFDVLVPVRRELRRHRGQVHRRRGDGALRRAGGPRGRRGRCLTAALEMMALLRGLRVRLAVSTWACTSASRPGTVVTGGLGSRGREEYSVIGDAVNLAARLADASEAGQILVGPAAHRLAADGFEFGELAPLDLKGKAEPVPVFSPRGRGSALGATGDCGVSSRLVGREAEMQRLRAAVEALAAGSGAAVALVGRAGPRQEPAGGRGPRGLAGRRPVGRGHGARRTGRRRATRSRPGSWTTSSAWRRTLPAAEIEAALRAAVRSAFPDRGRVRRCYPVPRAACAACRWPPDDDDRVGHLAPEALRDRLRTAFAAFVRALSLVSPLVLVWEDLHWADASSLDVAESVLPLTAECPLLTVVRVPPARGRHRRVARARCGASLPRACPALRLTPLDAERQRRRWSTACCRVEDLPDDTKRLLLEKADGNPFFLEELLRSLLDAGLVWSATAARWPPRASPS